MRIALVFIQLCILGAAFLLVVMPFYAALTGLAFLALEQPDIILRAIIELILYQFGAGSSLAGIGIPLLIFALPWLAAFAANIFCGFLAYYGGMYRKARKWGVIVNGVAMGIYVALMALIVFGIARSSTADMDMVLGVLASIAVVLAWNSYFFVAIRLFRAMPERPDLAASVKWMRIANYALWTAWAVAGAAGVVLLIYYGFYILAALLCVLVAVSALPFVYNARAVGRIAAERKKTYAAKIFVADIILALFALVFVPPLGVALALSAALLFFLMEMVFLRRADAATVAESVPEGTAAVCLSGGAAGDESRP